MGKSNHLNASVDIRIKVTLYTFFLVAVLLFSFSVIVFPKKGTEFLMQEEKIVISQINQQQKFTEVNQDQTHKSTILFIYILLILLVSGFIIFRIIDRKNKQILSLKEKEMRDQIIKELKIDHQLLASRAVLLGEEKERGRISRDLHDGLGGRLSGIKILLSSLKAGSFLQEEMNDKLEQSIIQLNSSISELRMIAHNLMPEALVNFGLKDALNDLCTHLKGGKTEISFLFYGEPFRFDNSIETSFFRIAQEAVNNSLKYSGADKIIVQLIQDDSWVNLTIQDNGKGFDVEKLTNKKGGIKNIRARAESFDGRFHLDSRSGIGTEIIVEFIYNPDLLFETHV